MNLKLLQLPPFICVKVPNCLIEMSLFPPSPLLLLLSNDLPILSTILEADRTFFTHTEGTWTCALFIFNYFRVKSQFLYLLLRCFFFLPTYTSVLFLQSLKGTLGYCSSDGTLYSLYRSDILGHNGIFSRIYINYMQLLSGTSHNPIYVLQMTQNYSASAHYVSNFIKFLISCSYDITWSFIAHIALIFFLLSWSVSTSLKKSL